jgi:cytidylate kinase
MSRSQGDPRLGSARLTDDGEDLVQRHDLVVAIDGPSGSGKSTVARAVAVQLGLRYLDTGAMYRAVTWSALTAGIDLADPVAVAAAATSTALQIDPDPVRFRIRADDHDVTEAVRRPDVTAAVSAVSAVPAVRAAMLEAQRAIIDDGGIVVEGRDIGTTVAPDAAVKVFLTADPQTRAERRVGQDGSPGGTVAATVTALAARDQSDSTRRASPLRQAPDALVLDSTTLDVEAVVDRIVSRVLDTGTGR